MDMITENFYSQLVDHALFYLATYEKGEEIISDFAYDQLVNNLRAIENRNPEWIRPDSPTQIISVGKDMVFGDKQPHAVRMGSQSNIFTPKELLKFLSLTEFTLYSVGVKYDGLALALHYSDGRLCRALTRGTGLTGTDVFQNAVNAQGVPGKIPVADPLVVFHGEIVISFKNFNDINAILGTEGSKKYANPRAAAAGILQGSGRFTDRLEFMLWEVPALPVRLFDGDDSHSVRLLRAHRLKVGVNPPTAPTLAENVAHEILRLEQQRAEFDYQIDGVVIKIDDIYERDNYGWSRKHPNWSTAWKFEPESAQTVLTDVGFQVTAHGSIVPVAKVNPVDIGGFTVSSVKMYNLQVLFHSGAYIGDTVTVARRGDVHNEIVAIDFENRPVDAVPPIVPEVCPSCNSPLDHQVSGMLICPNFHGCDGQQLMRLKKYLAPDGIGVPIPLTILTLLLKQQRIRDVADLHTLRVEDFTALRVGEARAMFFVAKLSESLELPMSKHLSLLNIPTIAAKASALLADSWYLDTLVAAVLSEEGRQNIAELIGEKQTKALYDFCSDERGASLLNKMGRLLRE